MGIKFETWNWIRCDCYIMPLLAQFPFYFKALRTLQGTISVYISHRHAFKKVFCVSVTIVIKQLVAWMEKWKLFLRKLFKFFEKKRNWIIIRILKHHIDVTTEPWWFSGHKFRFEEEFRVALGIYRTIVFFLSPVPFVEATGTMDGWIKSMFYWHWQYIQISP